MLNQTPIGSVFSVGRIHGSRNQAGVTQLSITSQTHQETLCFLSNNSELCRILDPDSKREHILAMGHSKASADLMTAMWAFWSLYT